MSAPELVLLIGLQAAGKSSFYRERFGSSHLLVSKDLMRSAKAKSARQERELAQALRSRRSVVLDNTSVSRKAREPVIALGRELGARIVGYCFEPDFEACLERNRRRSGRARVADVALHVARRDFQPPARDEGFDELYEVRLDPAGRGFIIARPMDKEKIMATVSTTSATESPIKHTAGGEMPDATPMGEQVRRFEVNSSVIAATAGGGTLLALGLSLIGLGVGIYLVRKRNRLDRDNVETVEDVA